VGEILADLATTGHTPWDISLFDPLRFGEPGSIPTPPTERP
jgi:glycine/D-amino acid oxidase-like deaminating enzyme